MSIMRTSQHGPEIAARSCDVCGEDGAGKYGTCSRGRGKPECVQEYRRREYVEHREHLREYHRRYHLENQEERCTRERMRGKTFHGKAVMLLAAARRRAGQGDLPFDLDISWMESELAYALEHGCPYLGIEIRLDVDIRRVHSPSVDRFYPDGGYLKSNCLIVSYKGNRIKNDATVDEFQAMAVNIAALAVTRFARGEAA